MQVNSLNEIIINVVLLEPFLKHISERSIRRDNHAGQALVDEVFDFGQIAIDNVQSAIQRMLCNVESLPGYLVSEDNDDQNQERHEAKEACHNTPPV